MSISGIRMNIPAAYVAPSGPLGQAARPEKPNPPKQDTGVDEPQAPRNEGPLCGIPEHPPVYI